MPATQAALCETLPAFCRCPFCQPQPPPAEIVQKILAPEFILPGIQGQGQFTIIDRGKVSSVK